MEAVYIGLGSNLDDPVAHVESACKEISQQQDIQLLKASGLYRSAPMGPADQPCYVNAVAEIATVLSAPELMRVLQALETAHGRLPTAVRWSARPLDLDILLYGEKIIKTKSLTIPHLGLFERAFVLYPLLEISSETLLVPGYGRLGELIAHCPKGDLELIKHRE